MKRLVVAGFLLALAGVSPAWATVYEIGPGKTYTTIGAAPWSSLVAGDNVKIYYATYHEKLEITVRGAAGNNIVIEGVPDGGGNLPIIDGTGATQGSNFHVYGAWQYHAGLGLVFFGVKDDYVSNPVLPGYITLKNLRIQGAASGAVWTDKDGGTHTLGTRGTPGLYIQTAEHLTLENLEITNNGMGLFGNSNYGNYPPAVTRDLTVRGCKVWNNGTVGGYLDHNAYVEADGVTYEYNWFGAPRSGSYALNVKDRSAGFVFRYNWVQNGLHHLDMVECQEGCGYILNETTYREAWVYGNVFWNVQVDPDGGSGPAARIIHYGAEYNNPRNGTLYFYNNTMVSEINQTGTGALYRAYWFEFTNNLSTAEIHGNIFYARPYTNPGGTVTAWYWKDDSVFTAASYGNMTFGANLVSSAYPTYYTTPTGGTVQGLENNIVATGNDPGFTDVATQTFTITSSSQAVDTSTALPARVASGNYLGQDFTPVKHYIKTASSADRTVHGSTLDIGAYENDGYIAPTITTTQLPNGIRDAAYDSTTLSVTGGTGPYTWSVSAGTICDGLSLSAAGVITGTPTTAGTCNFTARVQDSIPSADTQALSITITIPPPSLEVSVQAGSNSAVVTFGLAGLAYGQSCFATLRNASTGSVVGQTTVATGAAKRLATFTGLNAGGSYKAEAACGSSSSPQSTFTTQAPAEAATSYTYKAKVPAYVKTAATAQQGSTSALGLVTCFDSDCGGYYTCKMAAACPGDVCSISRDLTAGVHYIWHRWSWLPAGAEICAESATYATTASRKGLVAIP